MTNAVVYARISSDRVGAGLGVERQQQDCEQLAHALGWTIVNTYVDNDISAYSGKPRPAYKAMLQSIDDGEAKAVLAWHADRLHRSPAELEEFIDLCERRGAAVRTVQSGEIDLSTPSGRMTARIVGAVARHEIDHARQRLKAAHVQAAEMGVPKGRVAYGYKIEMVDGEATRVPDGERAEIIREAARRVLSGETLYSIAADLNGREIPTARGAKRWRASLLREMLVRPTYAGLRSHHGTISQGQWEPLIAPEDHRVLCSILNDPRRKTHRGVAPKYLLSGIARCGKCGETVSRLKSNGNSVYACHENRCVSRRIEPVDELVEAAIIAWCERRSGPDELVDEGVAEAAIEAQRLRAQLDDFCDKAAAGDLSAASLARVEAKLLPQIKAAEARSRSAVAPEVVDLLGVNARQHWMSMPLTSKRNVIRTLVDVTIHPGGRGYVFRPELIRVDWL